MTKNGNLMGTDASLPSAWTASTKTAATNSYGWNEIKFDLSKAFLQGSEGSYTPTKEVIP
jgi:hypothetical protein